MEWIEPTEAEAAANETFRQRLQALIQVGLEEKRGSQRI